MPDWKDRLLEFAYTLYVEGMCDCGRPKFECRHPDNAGLYEVADVTCYAQAAIEEHTGQKGFKPEPGQRFYATEIDDELITRRAFGPAALDEGYNADSKEPQNQHGEANPKPKPAEEQNQRQRSDAQ